MADHRGEIIKALAAMVRRTGEDKYLSSPLANECHSVVCGQPFGA